MAAPVRKPRVENFHVGFQNLEAGRCRLLASNPVKLTAADPRVVDPREPVRRGVNPRKAELGALTLRGFSDVCYLHGRFAGVRNMRGYSNSLQYGFR
jgi:hypothetical protein